MMQPQGDPMQFLYHAAYLNEKGASLMKGGKQHEAFESFIAAVESVNTLSQIVEAKQRNHHHYHYHYQQQQLEHRTLSSLPSVRRRNKQQQQQQQCNRQNKTTTMSMSLQQHRRRRRSDPFSSSSCIISSDECFDEEEKQQQDMMDISDATNDSYDDHHHQSATFVYNQAFRFTPPPPPPRRRHGEDSYSSYDDDEEYYERLIHYIKLYRAILTFNSALTFHQRCRTTTSNGTTAVSNLTPSMKRTAETVATNLYLDAINLLTTTTTTTTTQPQDHWSQSQQSQTHQTLDTSRVLIATINNVTMLFYDMRHYAKFNTFQKELHRLLIDIETKYPGGERTNIQHPKCLRRLFFNATLLSTPKTANAA